jgi:hypothetical protein
MPRRSPVPAPQAARSHTRMRKRSLVHVPALRQNHG